MKVGDRVKVINELSTFRSMVGRIVKGQSNNIVGIIFDNEPEKGLYAFRIDSLERVPNNTLITIGLTGIKRAYLNLSKEEAARRYAASENEGLIEEMHITPEYVLREVNIEIIEFDDEFGVYDAWK